MILFKLDMNGSGSGNDNVLTLSITFSDVNSVSFSAVLA